MELTLDSNGRVVIKFRHLDKSNELYQKILGEFIRLAKEKGLHLMNPSGMISTNGESHEDYVITPKY